MTDGMFCHPPKNWTGRYLTAIADVTAGKSARGQRRSVMVLPTWVWCGQKPSRIIWDTGPAVPAKPAKIGWRLDKGGRGATFVTLGPKGNPQHHLAGRVPGTVELRRDDPARLAAGVQPAWWQAVLSLESAVQREAGYANRKVSSEMNDYVASNFTTVTDEIAVESIADRLLLGSDDGKPSVVHRIVERSTHPDVWRNTSPRHFVRQALRVAAEDFIRREIGDPHIGPKVRQVAAALGETGDLDDVVTEYRRCRPNDRLGKGRASAALSVTRRIYQVTPTEPGRIADLVDSRQA